MSILRFSKSVVPLLQKSYNYKALHIYQQPTVIGIRSIALAKNCLNQCEKSEVVNAPTDTLFTRIARKIPFLDVDKYRLQTSAYLLYELVADKINYTEFFDEFSLPDTFYSWFVITELHVWMILVRCMAEGKEGRFARNKVIEAMWADVGTRAKKLGAHNPTGVRQQINELSEQFQAALISYDEGLEEDDIVLAGALWRRIFQMGEVDAEHLDALIRYIRRQIRILDNTSKEDFFVQRQITWEKLKD